MGKKAQSKQSPTIHLRRAKAEDVVNIFKLVRRQPGSIISQAQEQNHWVIQYLLEQIVTGYVVVADLSGRLVGVLGCKVLPEEGGVKTFGLDTFAFSDEFEDTGVEKALMETLCTFMKKSNHVLKAVVNNDEFGHKQLRFILEAGFKVTAAVYKLGAGTEEDVLEDVEPEFSPVETEDGADAPPDEPEWTPETPPPADR